MGRPAIRSVGKKRQITFTYDKDLFPDVVAWMHANGYGEGEEQAAFKQLIRLAVTSDPITARLADAKARAYNHVVHALNLRIYTFLGELSAEIHEAIRHTSHNEMDAA